MDRDECFPVDDCLKLLSIDSAEFVAYTKSLWPQKYENNQGVRGLTGREFRDLMFTVERQRAADGLEDALKGCRALVEDARAIGLFDSAMTGKMSTLVNDALAIVKGASNG